MCSLGFSLVGSSSSPVKQGLLVLHLLLQLLFVLVQAASLVLHQPQLGLQPLHLLPQLRASITLVSNLSSVHTQIKGCFRLWLLME